MATQIKNIEELRQAYKNRQAVYVRRPAPKPWMEHNSHFPVLPFLNLTPHILDACFARGLFIYETGSVDKKRTTCRGCGIKIRSNGALDRPPAEYCAKCRIVYRAKIRRPKCEYRIEPEPGSVRPLCGHPKKQIAKPSTRFCYRSFCPIKRQIWKLP